MIGDKGVAFISDSISAISKCPLTGFLINLE
jgi:hypothetical protein